MSGVRPLNIQLQSLIETFRFVDIVDILLVALIIYFIYKSIKDTRALSLLKGLIVLAVIYVVSHAIDLHVVNWILQQSLTIIMVALPVVFQPELRRTLERLGRGGLLGIRKEVPEKELMYLVGEVIGAARNMSRERIGALIVFEREVGLGDIVDTGILLDSHATRELLENIFVLNTPLHDGAVVIRGTRIAAAGCLLPLTQNRNLSTELGTRHRAAIGISEQTDAVVIVVSEETGKISYTYGGHIYRHLTEQELQEMLMAFLGKSTSPITRFLKWRDGK